MNNKNNILRTACVFMAGAFLLAACNEGDLTPSFPDDTLALMSPETSIGVTTTIAENDADTKASSTYIYAHNELHAGKTADFRLCVPGGSSQTEFSAADKTIATWSEDFGLKLKDFNLSTGSGTIVTRWTQLEATQDGVEDRLVGATRLVDIDATPTLGYTLKHARTKVTLSVYHEDGVNYNILDGTASITHQKSEADLFVKDGNAYRTLMSAAATNTNHPAADYEETDVTMLTYRQNNSPEMATTNLEIPHSQSGSSYTSPTASDNNRFVGIVYSTPRYVFDSQTETLTELESPGFTDDDYITIVTPDNEYVGLELRGVKYKLKLKDITGLESFEPNTHVQIKITIMPNHFIKAAITVTEWEEATGGADMEGDDSYLGN